MGTAKILLFYHIMQEKSNIRKENDCRYESPGIHFVISIMHKTIHHCMCIHTKMILDERN